MKDSEEVKKAYLSGFQRGVWMYAHWKDGKQHVGTTGMTLEDAMTKSHDDVNRYFKNDISTLF